MKSYQEVVRERYDTKEINRHIYDNQYSLINPVGFYGRMRIQKVFYTIYNKLKEMGIDITTLKILDVGCGSGGWTRFFAEIIESPSSIYGIDLSKHRIHIASKMNSSINYSIGDIVDLKHKEDKFDLISAIDVFMFLNTKEQIKRALSNINLMLTDGGIFIWYDPYDKDHFVTETNQEGAGYNSQQIETFAEEKGFTKLFMISVFKNVFWKYHSMYLVKRFPFWLVSLMEKCCPGSSGNLCYVFKKINRST